MQTIFLKKISHTANLDFVKLVTQIIVKIQNGYYLKRRKEPCIEIFPL